MSVDATTQKYGTIITATGKAAIANAVATNTLIDIKYIALGDGGGNEYYPGESQTTLKKQVYQMSANSVYVDHDNPNWIVVEGLIPESAGGFIIREAAIKTGDGNVIAIGSYPTSYKPKLEEGSAVGIGFKFIMEVTNADVVNMNIDPSTVYATIFYVDNKVSSHAKETNAHGGTYIATPSRLMHRNEEGRCQVADPKVNLDAVNLETLIYYLTGFIGDILPWDENATYDPLPWIVWGGDNLIHIATNPSGVGTEAGAQDPTATEGYWLTLAKYLAGNGGSGGGSGGSGEISVAGYPAEWRDFMEQTPPSGWMVRNGALITNASLVVPELLAALQKPENGWKCVSESAWQTLSLVPRFNGMGGVSKFVIDASADTIRLPDTRDTFLAHANPEKGFNVGDAQGDGIPKLTATGNINATVAAMASGSGGGGFGNINGNLGIRQIPITGTVTIDGSNIPIQQFVQPKRIGMLGCVYVGNPAV